MKKTLKWVLISLGGVVAGLVLVWAVLNAVWGRNCAEH